MLSRIDLLLGQPVSVRTIKFLRVTEVLSDAFPVTRLFSISTNLEVEQNNFKAQKIKKCKSVVGHRIPRVKSSAVCFRRCCPQSPLPLILHCPRLCTLPHSSHPYLLFYTTKHLKFYSAPDHVHCPIHQIHIYYSTQQKNPKHRIPPARRSFASVLQWF